MLYAVFFSQVFYFSFSFSRNLYGPHYRLYHGVVYVMR